MKHSFHSPFEKDVPQVFGKAGDENNLVFIRLPYQMHLSWQPTVVQRMRCHRKIADAMTAIFNETLDTFGLKDIENLGLDVFGGCFCKRKKRNGKEMSMHSWGIAVDLDPQQNKLGWGAKKARLGHSDAKPFWDIVEKHGAISLGRAGINDWMQFQFAKPNPKSPNLPSMT